MNLIKPMKMTDIPVTDVDLYFDDDDWVMEQKHDGARALVHVVVSDDGQSSTEWFASGGGPLKFAAAALHFETLKSELVYLLAENGVQEAWLDGELMPEEGTLRLFDVPMLTWKDMNRIGMHPQDGYANRRATLYGLSMVGSDTSPHVHFTYTAMTPDEKRGLWAKINAEGVEGGMLKHVLAPYEPGVRTKMQRKLKLVKSADVIVTSVERRFDHKGMVTHGSADLAVTITEWQDPKPYLAELTGRRASAADINAWRNGTKAQQAKELAYTYAPRPQLKVGAASLIGKDLTIDVGDVVEINYLYWGGEAVVQPRIVRKRLPEEKTPAECTLDQIPAYSKLAVA